VQITGTASPAHVVENMVAARLDAHRRDIGAPHAWAIQHAAAGTTGALS
jgi:hypothetical protein